MNLNSSLLCFVSFHVHSFTHVHQSASFLVHGSKPHPEKHDDVDPCPLPRTHTRTLPRVHRSLSYTTLLGMCSDNKTSQTQPGQGQGREQIPGPGPGTARDTTRTNQHIRDQIQQVLRETRRLGRNPNRKTIPSKNPIKDPRVVHHDTDLSLRNNNTNAAQNIVALVHSVPIHQKDTFLFNQAMSACAHLGDLDSVLNLFELMNAEIEQHKQHNPNSPQSSQRNIVQIDTFTYTALITACDKARQPQRAIDFLQDMKHNAKVLPNAPQPNTVVYNACISACARAGWTKQALALLQEMCTRASSRDLPWSKLKVELEDSILDEDSSSPDPDAHLRCRPDVVSFSSCISALANNLQGSDYSDDCLILIQMMHDCGVKPNRFSYNACLSSYARHGRVDDALQLLESMIHIAQSHHTNHGLPDVISYSTCIRACEIARDRKRAFSILETAIQRGINPDVIMLNGCIATCIRDGSFEDATMIFNKIYRLKLRPNVVTWSSYIAVCARSSLHYHKAYQILCRMRNAGLTPNTVTYNACIDAYSKAGNWSTCLDLLRDMKASHVTPNVITYNTCMHAFKNSKEWRYAFDLMNEMKAAGIALNDHIYNTAISLCVSGSRNQQAYALFTEMKHTGVLPTVHTYAILMNSPDTSPQEAIELLAQLRAQGLHPNVYVYNACLNAYARRGMWENALALVMEMAQNNVSADSATCNACIYACVEAGQLDIAQEILKEMGHGDVPPDTISYNTVLMGLYRQKRNMKCVALFQELQEVSTRDTARRVGPDKISLNIYCAALARLGWIDAALDIVDRMHSTKIRTYQYVYNEIIVKCMIENKFNDDLDFTSVRGDPLWEKRYEMLAQIFIDSQTRKYRFSKSCTKYLTECVKASSYEKILLESLK